MTDELFWKCFSWLNKCVSEERFVIYISPYFLSLTYWFLLLKLCKIWEKSLVMMNKVVIVDRKLLLDWMCLIIETYEKFKKCPILFFLLSCNVINISILFYQAFFQYCQLHLLSVARPVLKKILSCLNNAKIEP